MEARPPIVIKVGGAVLQHLEAFWPQVQTLARTHHVVIVHGGGAAATSLAHRLGHQPRIVQGRRVTTLLDLQIVEWTMRGGVNVDLVGQATAHGLHAVGLCGADGGMVRVIRRKPWMIDGEAVDFGWVGDIEAVNTQLLHTLFGIGHLPILAPLGVDGQGRRYNVNADTVAAAIAVALAAETLLLVTATGGILRHAHNPDTLFRSLTASALREGQAGGWISGGMHVKGQVAIEALTRGVGQVFITAPGDLIGRTTATRIVL